MLNRLLCATIGHAWDGHLRHGHPSKCCDRCGCTEWAVRVRTAA